MFSKHQANSPPRKLSTRLTFWYVCAIVVPVLALLLVLYWSIGIMYDRRIEADLIGDFKEFTLKYHTGGLEYLIQELEQEAATEDHEKEFLRLFDARDTVLFSSDMDAWPMLGDGPVSLQDSSPDQLPEIHEIAGLEDSARMIQGRVGPHLLLQFGEIYQDKYETLAYLLRAFLIALAVITPLAGGIGWLMARRAARDIERVTQTAARIQLGNLDQRVSLKTNDLEIQTLADTFNGMLERIRDLVVEVKQMSDHIAHDLRSPLARIRAIAEGMLAGKYNDREWRDAAARTIEECDHLLQMINAMLNMAQAEAGMTEAPRHEVDYVELVADACELFEPLAEQNRITLFCELAESCRGQGLIAGLQRMLANMLDNAIKFTPAGGKINVKLWQDSKSIFISIVDNGIGISSENQLHIFDRFFQADQSHRRKGCGMGLSFASAVAKAHTGRISVQSNPGAGTAFLIQLNKQ